MLMGGHMKDSEKDYMTTKEAAEYIGYSVSTLRNWRRNKDYGPKFVLTKSGRYWYSKAMLDEWREACWSRASSHRQRLEDIPQNDAEDS